MKVQFVKYILLLLIPITGFGQELIIARVDQNILYSGIDNRLGFAMKSFFAKNIKITASRGQVRYDMYHQLIYRVCDVPAGVITLYAVNKKNNRLIDSAEFRLKKLPDPSYRLQTSYSMEGHYSGKNILADSHGIRAMLESETDLDILVLQIKITITTASGSTIVLLNNNAVFSQEVKDAFHNLQAGDVVTISDVQVKIGCESFTRTLPKKMIFSKRADDTVRHSE